MRTVPLLCKGQKALRSRLSLHIRAAPCAGHIEQESGYTDISRLKSKNMVERPKGGAIAPDRCSATALERRALPFQSALQSGGIAS